MTHAVKSVAGSPVTQSLMVQSNGGKKMKGDSEELLIREKLYWFFYNFPRALVTLLFIPVYMIIIVFGGDEK